MGAGKTSVGRAVASQAGAPFLDLDAVIEAGAGRTIEEIFATEGEPAFRAMETLALGEALEPGRVVALGGGTPVAEANRNLLQAAAVTVYLEVDIETVWRRLAGATGRPLAAARSRDELAGLLDDRRSSYEFADHTVDAERSVQEIAREVLSLWNG